MYSEDKSSKIDYLDVENEKFVVRGKDITELMCGMDFVDNIFHTLLHRVPDEKEKQLFNAVLTSMHAGTDLYPPTVLLPRIAASTGVPISQALAAGFCAGGEYHVGALEKAMEFYDSIAEKSEGPLEDYVRYAVENRIECGDKIYGFGHPLFKEDPRPKALRGYAARLDYRSDFIDIYDNVLDVMREKKGVKPNIDGINSALLLSMGFEPKYGSALFLFARTIGMIAHVVEESKQPPWDAWHKVVGAGLK